MNAKIFYLLLFWGFGNACHAQDIINDLKQLRKKYFLPQGEIKYSLRMLFYDVSNLQQVEDSSHGIFCVAKDKSFSDMENVVSITNDSLILIVDKTNKKIFLSKNHKKETSKNFSVSILDSMANSLDLKMALLPASSKELKKVRFQIPEGEVDSADIEYNSTSFLVSSIVIYYKYTIDFESEVKPVVKIFYYNQKHLPEINPAHFDINKYVLIDKKKAKVQEAYKTYQLINNLIF